jgi:benzoyl-CoA reductase/2-hydroxyglutaryl-CoA dehydratase subunit BcrC/BadD/HgdB
MSLATIEIYPSHPAHAARPAQAAAPSLKTREELESQLEYVRASKKDHAYSPAVSQLYDLAMSYVEDAEAAHRTGRKAAWVVGIQEAPLLYATDTIPISLTELGRMGSADTVAIAEDYFQLPKETCSMVSSLLGEWYLRRDRTVPRMVVFNSACEPLNQAWELVQDEGYEVYRIESVARAGAGDKEREAQMLRFLANELVEAGRWLNDGKAVDETRVHGEILRNNRIFAKARRILELRLGNPLYVKSLATMFLLMGTGHYFGKPQAFEEALDALIEELESADTIAPPKGKIVPVAWVGGRGQEFGVYKAIDDCGGAVLSWRTPNVVSLDLREDVPPFDALAERLLSGQTFGSPVHRLKSIEEQLAAHGARGILFYTYVGCSFAGIYNEIQREYFHKKGIPSITIEGSFQVGPPTGQLLTRVRAFIEMLSTS